MHSSTAGLFIVLTGGLLGCNHWTIPEGPSGCSVKCKGWNQEMVGMVAMGDFAEACVCAVPGKSASTLQSGAVAAMEMTAAGVVASQQQQQAQMHP
jgi:hypothetical protein